MQHEITELIRRTFTQVVRSTNVTIAVSFKDRAWVATLSSVHGQFIQCTSAPGDQHGYNRALVYLAANVLERAIASGSSDSITKGLINDLFEATQSHANLGNIRLNILECYKQQTTATPPRGTLINRVA